MSRNKDLIGSWRDPKRKHWATGGDRGPSDQGDGADFDGLENLDAGVVPGCDSWIAVVADKVSKDQTFAEHCVVVVLLCERFTCCIDLRLLETWIRRWK